jgi:hypothetical protein
MADVSGYRTDVLEESHSIQLRLMREYLASEMYLLQRRIARELGNCREWCIHLTDVELGSIMLRHGRLPADANGV